MKKWKKVVCFMLTMCLLAATVFVSGNSIAEAKTGKWKHSKAGYWYSYSDGSYAKNYENIEKVFLVEDLKWEILSIKDGYANII